MHDIRRIWHNCSLWVYELWSLVLPSHGFIKVKFKTSSHAKSPKQKGEATELQSWLSHKHALWPHAHGISSGFLFPSSGKREHWTRLLYMVLSSSPVLQEKALVLSEGWCSCCYTYLGVYLPGIYHLLQYLPCLPLLLLVCCLSWSKKEELNGGSVLKTILIGEIYLCGILW